MPSEIRPKLLKDITEMDFDERDNLLAVLFAMEHLGKRATPQTVRAVHRELFGMVSKPIIGDYRRWLVYHGVVEPPEGFEDPETWSGRHLLFTIHWDNLPSELDFTYASNHVLQKRFELLVDKKFASYQDGNLKINAHRFLERARETIGEDVFLDGIMDLVRPRIPPQFRNFKLDRHFFIEHVDGKIFDTDFEKHRYPLWGLKYWARSKSQQQRQSRNSFVFTQTLLIQKLLKLLTNLRPFALNL